MQSSKAVPSRLQAKVAPVGSLELNVNEALAVVVTVLPSAGPVSMVVSGGVVSLGGTLTIQLRVAGVGSVLPAASLAATEKVWLPFARPEYGAGDVQGPDGAPSRLQAKVAPVGSDEVNEIEPLFVVSVLPSTGSAPMVVSGGVVSPGGTATVQVLLAGDGSVLDDASIARTENAWLALLLRPVYDTGEEHVAKAAVSSLHSKVELLPSLELNVNEALLVATVLPSTGPLRIVVSGGVVSTTLTVHVLVAAEPSMFPAGSMALTANR